MVREVMYYRGSTQIVAVHILGKYYRLVAGKKEYITERQFRAHLAHYRKYLQT